LNAIVYAIPVFLALIAAAVGVFGGLQALM